MRLFVLIASQLLGATKQTCISSQHYGLSDFGTQARSGTITQLRFQRDLITNKATVQQALSTSCFCFRGFCGWCRNLGLGTCSANPGHAFGQPDIRPWRFWAGNQTTSCRNVTRMLWWSNVMIYESFLGKNCNFLRSTKIRVFLGYSWDLDPSSWGMPRFSYRVFWNVWTAYGSGVEPSLDGSLYISGPSLFYFHVFVLRSGGKQRQKHSRKPLEEPLIFFTSGGSKRG